MPTLEPEQMGRLMACLLKLLGSIIEWVGLITQRYVHNLVQCREHPGLSVTSNVTALTLSTRRRYQIKLSLREAICIIYLVQSIARSLFVLTVA